MSIIRLTGHDSCLYEYDERQKIGQGGMGEVFLGIRTDPHGARSHVAVKHLTLVNQETLICARREASVQLHNDNLVYMYDFIETDDGDILSGKNYYVVSEYVEGISLDAFLHGQLENRDGSISPVIQTWFNEYISERDKTSKAILMHLLSGVMALHDAHIIHRDIDPTNIMLTVDGAVKLMDYGASMKMDEDRSDKFIGKISYAAPELINGDFQHQGPATDIYSVGIVYFQLLTGHLPFRADKSGFVDMQHSIPLNEIGTKAIRSIIAKATAKDPSKRYQSAAQFRSAVEEEIGPTLNRKKVAWVSLALLVLAVCVLSLVYMSSGKDDSNVKSTEVATTRIRVDKKTVANTDLQLFQRYISLLNSSPSDSVIKGFVSMKQLAEKNYPDAVYELAYIYAFNPGEKDATRLKRVLGIATDKYGKPVSKTYRDRGVQWLEKAISIDHPLSYKCLYWLAGYQTSMESIVKILNKAKDKAEKAHDKAFADKIDDQLWRIKSNNR